MRVAVFSTKPYDRHFLEQANAGRRHELAYFETRLNAATARLAAGYPAVCPFVHDRVCAVTAAELASGGTRLIALRSAGFNNVDLAAAARAGLRVARVPAYSPNAVAEHAVALILSLNRKIHRAHARVRDGNFSLEGLLGFDLCARTVGVVGTGKIGEIAARILRGFGCEVLAYDPRENAACAALGVAYTSLDDLYSRADIISLHCPLTPENHHMIDARTLARMRRGVMIVNTSRGGLIDARAAIEALKSGQVGSLALDVYEEEDAFFFEDYSERIIQDDVLIRLMSFPNVIVTAHQGFFTEEAMRMIAEVTLANVDAFEKGEALSNEVVVERIAR